MTETTMKFSPDEIKRIFPSAWEILSPEGAVMDPEKLMDIVESYGPELWTKKERTLIKSMRDPYRHLTYRFMVGSVMASGIPMRYLYGCDQRPEWKWIRPGTKLPRRLFKVKGKGWVR